MRVIEALAALIGFIMAVGIDAHRCAFCEPVNPLAKLNSVMLSENVIVFGNTPNVELLPSNGKNFHLFFGVQPRDVSSNYPVLTRSNNPLATCARNASGEIKFVSEGERHHVSRSPEYNIMGWRVSGVYQLEPEFVSEVLFAVLEGNFAVVDPDVSSHLFFPKYALYMSGFFQPISNIRSCPVAWCRIGYLIVLSG
jgi:hypothetical protein